MPARFVELGVDPVNRAALKKIRGATRVVHDFR
jgi:hypothetical protein